MVERGLDSAYLSLVMHGLPNLRSIYITDTIEIDKLIRNRTVRRGSMDPPGTPCVGKHRSWGVSSVAEKGIAVRPRQDGRQFEVFLRAAVLLKATTPPVTQISELHVDDSIWGDQGLEIGGHNLGKLGPKSIINAAPVLRQLKTLTVPLGRYGKQEDCFEIGSCAAQILSAIAFLEHLTV